MREADVKEFIETHLPGTLDAISDLARRQLTPYHIILSSVSGMQSRNGAFEQVSIRLHTPSTGNQLSNQNTICAWLALHRLKMESIRFDPRAQEFVLFVKPPVPVMARHA